MQIEEIIERAAECEMALKVLKGYDYEDNLSLPPASIIHMIEELHETYKNVIRSLS